MPFLALTKGSKAVGIQTYAKAVRLMPELREVELEYLSLRDWYVETLNLKAQLDEHLAQTKAAGNLADVREIGHRLHAVNSQLVDTKERVRLAGERSWAEAFVIAANHMLPRDVDRRINEEADRLLGRQRHELARKEG